MAGRKENIKALFSNSRTRTIILFTGLVLFAVILFGFVRFFMATREGADIANNANLKRAPANIHSIPGSVNQTAQYAALQQEQNIQQAKAAQVKGSSAIPTIIRAQQFGEGVDVIASQSGTNAVGFLTLSMQDQMGPQQSIWTQNLNDDHCNTVTLKRVLAEGATLKDIHPPCSCRLLKENGFGLKELSTVCACPDLKQAGYSAAELKGIGYTAEKLKECGYSACETRGAEFTAQQMKDGHYSDGELLGAGFSPKEIERAGGVPDGVTLDDIKKAGCNIAALKTLRAKGVSASAVERINGCAVEPLKFVSYLPQELRQAGFSAAELKNAGFTPRDLHDAGFGARDLLNAGFNPDALKNAGFSPEDLDAALVQLPPDVTLAQVKNAGCSPETLAREEKAGIDPSLARKLSGCTQADIKDAGCDLMKLTKLKNMGVSAKEIQQISGCSAAQMKAAVFSGNDLLSAGFKPDELAGIGLSPIGTEQIKAAGCDPEKLKQLRAAGVTAKQIYDINGCSLPQLKAAMTTVKELADIGFAPDDFIASGINPEEMIQNSLIPSAVIASGRTANCSISSLRAARATGVSAKVIKETLGCSAAAMKAAGFDVPGLKREFTAAQLKNAGFSLENLKAGGFSSSDLKAAGLEPTPVMATKPTAYDSQFVGLPAVQVPSNPTVSTTSPAARPAQQEAKELQQIMDKQQQQAAQQRYQAQINQKTGLMLGAAKDAMQGWKKTKDQVYIASTVKPSQESNQISGALGEQNAASKNLPGGAASPSMGEDTIKTGDIVFAVMDTSVNTDEPGPILATIVSGRLKGSKLIGSFNLPSNASKIVIMFNTLSIPGKDKTVQISAYAIDPNTARTALSSETNHHYLQRYGALFASSFMSGMSSAIQSANTTVSVGGTGGVTNTTVSTIGRSTLDNALIALGEVGKSWSKTAQKEMNRPTTVEVYAGTGLGILFTQDVAI